MRRKANSTSKIQSIWHSAKLFSRKDAAKWCKNHDFATDVYRTRVNDDDGEITHHIHAQFEPDSESIIPDSWGILSDNFPEGITATICAVKKKASDMDLQFTKGTQSAKNPMEFIMSDETRDRMGDIIVAKGWDLAEFLKNPIALYSHDHQTPIGSWVNVRIVGKKLIGKLKLAKQGTSREIDTIRSLVEQRILKAVSVGFRPTESEPMKEGGYKFFKSVLHECSLVAVGANPNALSVAKSFGLNEDQAKRLLGQNAAPVKGSSTRSKTGRRLATKTGNKPMNIQAKIVAKQERMVAIRDELTTIKSVLEADDSVELDDDQIDQIDVLEEEMAATEKSIASLQKIEAAIAQKAQPVDQNPGYQYGPNLKIEEPGGSLIAKHVAVKLIAHMEDKPVMQVIRERYANDDRIPAIVKAAIAPADTTTPGWAAELVEQDIKGFLAELEPLSVYAALRARGVPLLFGGANSIKIPRRASNDRGMSPSFVGEGGAIPLGKMSFGSSTLNRYKIAVISDFTNELLQQSTPNIEALVRKAMLDDSAVKLDTALLDAAPAVSGVRPASILSGIAAGDTTASAGATSANVITDLKFLIGRMQAAGLGNPVLLMNSSRLLGLSTVTNATGQFMFRDEVAAGRLLGVPVISSVNVPAGTIAMIDADSFTAANDSPEFSISDQATVVQADAKLSVPSHAVTAAGVLAAAGHADEVLPGGGISVEGSPAGAGTAGYEAVSLWQTYSTGVRFILPTSWGMLRTPAVATITGAAW